MTKQERDFINHINNINQKKEADASLREMLIENDTLVAEAYGADSMDFIANELNMQR